MDIIRNGDPPLRDQSVNCGYCGCVFKYQESDIKKGYLSTKTQQHFYKHYVVYCPCCEVAITVPIAYSDIRI